jgi:hypothetical protein
MSADVCKLLQGCNLMRWRFRPGRESFPVFGRNGHNPPIEHIQLGSFERFTPNEITHVRS